MFVSMTLIEWLRNSFKLSALWNHGWLPLSFCLWLMFGSWFGLWMWQRLVKRIEADR